MALTRRLARPLLASIFVVGGLDALRHPEGKVKKASVVTEPLHDNVPATAGLETEALVRINSGVQVVAGVLLATGRFRRLASLLLMGSLVPTTYAGHRFWEETDESARTQQKMHFVKNLGLLGGLILAAVDTEGEPSLGWRAKRRARSLRPHRSAKHVHGQSGDLGSVSKAVVAAVPAVAGAAAESGNLAARRAHRISRHAARHVKTASLDVVHKAADAPQGLRNAGDAVTASLRDSRAGAVHAVQQSGVLASAARQLEPLAQSAVQAGAELTERAGQAVSAVGDRLPTS